MFRRKQASETKFVVEYLASSYWAFKLSERDFLKIFPILQAINLSQSSYKSLVLFVFDDTA